VVFGDIARSDAGHFSGANQFPDYGGRMFLGDFGEVLDAAAGKPALGTVIQEGLRTETVAASQIRRLPVRSPAQFAGQGLMVGDVKMAMQVE
jgi:hypothetical protein